MAANSALKNLNPGNGERSCINPIDPNEISDLRYILNRYSDLPKEKAKMDDSDEYRYR